MSKQLDFAATERRAKGMTDEALEYSIRDCVEAGEAAFDIEKAGCRVEKSQGYYMDEAGVYRAELNRRKANQ